MKNIRVFLCKNFQFLEVKFSIYLNRYVFVMFGNFFLRKQEDFMHSVSLLDPLL